LCETEPRQEGPKGNKMNPKLPLCKQPTQVLIAVLRHMYAAEKGDVSKCGIYMKIIKIIESRK